MTLNEWGIKWAVPFAALEDLRHSMGLNGHRTMPERARGTSEAAVDSVVVLEAARLDIPLWRNNVGALKDEHGRMVRYGLANSTKDENKLLASSDRIGIRKRSVAEMYAQGIQYCGQFVARETKPVGWRFTGTDREEGQFRWAELILSYGGDAAFVTGEGSF